MLKAKLHLAAWLFLCTLLNHSIYFFRPVPDIFTIIFDIEDLVLQIGRYMRGKGRLQFHGYHDFFNPITQNNFIPDFHGQNTVTKSIGMGEQFFILKIKTHTRFKMNAQVILIGKTSQGTLHDQPVSCLTVAPRKHNVFKIISRIIGSISVLPHQNFHRSLSCVEGG